MKQYIVWEYIRTPEWQGWQPYYFKTLELAEEYSRNIYEHINVIDSIITKRI